MTAAGRAGGLGTHEEGPGAGALAARLKMQYFLLFAPFAIATTYQNLHFKRVGFSNEQIGALNAIAAILAVVSPPLWGYAADRVRDKRVPLAILLVASGAAYPTLLLAHSFPVAAAFQALFGFFMAPCIALTDALVLEHLPRAGGDYARVRLWGSVGFICTLCVFGLFLGGGPLAPARGAGNLVPTFVAFALFRLVGAAWVFCLPPGKKHGGTQGYRGEFGALLRNGTLLLFLFSSFVCQAALRAYYVFFSIYLDGLHVPDSLKGVFWSLGVLSEVAFMLFAGRLLRTLGMRRMLVLGMAGGGLRLLLFSFALPLGAVAAAQVLHALAFGATHIATIAFLNAHVPERLRATGQTLYAAVVGGLAGAAGSWLSGTLSDAQGIPYAFRICALLAGAAAVLALFLPERRD